MNFADFSNNGEFVAIGCQNGIIYIFETETGDLIDTLNGHDGNEILELRFSNDSDRIVSLDIN